mmetsp:Transcript_9086/g.19603  ORF Transcript_9086/g.19603 Transcript_9086/m.19603 type:complete len:246 (+) Transcript_9086:394-1131(+)
MEEVEETTCVANVATVHFTMAATTASVMTRAERPARENLVSHKTTPSPTVWAPSRRRLIAKLAKKVSSLRMDATSARVWTMERQPVRTEIAFQGWTLIAMPRQEFLAIWFVARNLPIATCWVLVLSCFYDPGNAVRRAWTSALLPKSQRPVTLAPPESTLMAATGASVILMGTTQSCVRRPTPVPQLNTAHRFVNLKRCIVRPKYKRVPMEPRWAATGGTAVRSLSARCILVRTRWIRKFAAMVT